MVSLFRLTLSAFALLSVSATAGVSQGASAGWDPRRAQATRASLEELLRTTELEAASPAYSSGLRQRAREEADRIRVRLKDGDFQIGDQILLSVESDPKMTGTFTVDAGPSLLIPNAGTIPLAGILRSEVERHITTFVARVIKEPVVQVRTQIRLAILGGVSQPGFYTVETEAVVTDAIKKAGSFAAQAKITNIHVERDGKRVWSDAEFQKAINEGRTLDQLGLRTGDQVIVPMQGAGLRGSEPMLRAVGYLLTIPAAIYGLIRLF